PAELTVADFHNDNSFEPAQTANTGWGDGSPNTVLYLGWGYNPYWPWGWGGWGGGWWWPYGQAQYYQTSPLNELHFFTREGSYSVRTTLTDDTINAADTDPVSVADGALGILGTLPTLTADVNVSAGNPILATFADTDPNSTPSDFSVGI